MATDTVLGENLTRQQRTYDDLLELYDPTTAAITSTASSTGIALNVRKLQNFDVIVNVSAMDATTGDESYVLSVGICATVGGSYVEVVTLPNIRAAGVGTFVIPMSGELCLRLLSTAAFIRITATLSGTSPSLTFGAFVAPR